MNVGTIEIACRCVCVCAVELMRDWRGFRCRCFERGGEWQGSWIVMADSCSLTKRLSVSQQTGAAALSLCLHTQTWKYIHIYTGSRRFALPPKTHTQSSHPLHLGAWRRMSERKPIRRFPPTTNVPVLPASSLQSLRAKGNTEYGNTCLELILNEA